MCCREKSQDNLSSISNTNTLNALPKISPNEEINESIPVENLEHDIPDIYLNRFVYLLTILKQLLFIFVF